MFSVLNKGLHDKDVSCEQLESTVVSEQGSKHPNSCATVIITNILSLLKDIIT